MLVKEISKSNEDPRLSTVMSILSTSGGSFIVKLGNNDRTFCPTFYWVVFVPFNKTLIKIKNTIEFQRLNNDETNFPSDTRTAFVFEKSEWIVLNAFLLQSPISTFFPNSKFYNYKGLSSSRNWKNNTSITSLKYNKLFSKSS